MLNSVKNFLRDEGGNVTIESLVVIGGSVWMAGVILTDISTATMAMTERLETRLEYRTIVEDILGGYGTEEQQASYSDPDDSGTGTDDGGTGTDDSGDDDCGNPGNPGNEKCVGNAGENPNGDPDDWGSGSNGQGDANGNATDGNDNGNGGGNNGGGNGNGENSDDDAGDSGNNGNSGNHGGWGRWW